MSHFDLVAIGLGFLIAFIYYLRWVFRCEHSWRTRFFIFDSLTEVECRCLHCGKRKNPDHWFPELKDEIFRHIKQI